MELFYEVYEWLAGMVLSSARIMPSFILLPFLNNNILVGSVRMPVALLLGATLWPYGTFLLDNIDIVLYLGLLIKEVVIGLFLAFFLSFPFWFIHAAGCIIDNQRGATLSSTFDPVSGVDTSELANLFNLFIAAVFLCCGGMELVLQAISTSYKVSEPLIFCLPELWPLCSFLTQLMGQALVISSPVVAAFLILEAILGLLSRYAPQMNAFSLALTMKSSVAFFILALYFATAIPSKGIASMLNIDAIQTWFS